MNKLTVTLERTATQGEQEREKMKQRRAMNEIQGLLTRYRKRV